MYENAYMDFDAINAINARVVENIRTLLEEKGAKPTALSKAAGMGHTTIVDLLKKPGASPRYDTVLKIAHALNVDVRRITIGPDYLHADQRSAAILEKLLQLEPSELQILLKAADAQIEARASQHQEPPEAPE